MSRLEEPELIRELRDLRRDLDELKSAQRVGGDSLIGYLTYGSGSYDWLVGIDSVNWTKRYILTLDFSTARDGAIIDLFPFYSLNDPNVAISAYPPWAQGAPVQMFVQALPPLPDKAQWYVSFVNYGSFTWTIYAKWIFSGTDTGSWSMTAI